MVAVMVALSLVSGGQADSAGIDFFEK